MDSTNGGDEENGEGLKVYLFQKFAWALPIIGNLFLIGRDTLPSSTIQGAGGGGSSVCTHHAHNLSRYYWILFKHHFT